MEILEYTKDRIPDVLQFEQNLRKEEVFWGWNIDEAYVETLRASFEDPRFQNAVSYLAYLDGRVVGRIDASLIHSRFCGLTTAYLDWICVLKSCRHQGIAQALMKHLRRELKETYHAEDLVGLIASNPEAQQFYRSLENVLIKDEGIWITL